MKPNSTRNIRPMTRQRFVIEVSDETTEIDAEDLSLILEETLEANLPPGYDYLLLECEDENE